MGRDVGAVEFTREDRRRYRDKVRRDMAVLAAMVRDGELDAPEHPVSTGLEIELNLVDDEGAPSMANAAALEEIADPDFQTELGQFTLEINIPPHPIHATSAVDLEDSVRGSLERADERASRAGARLVMVGALPTLRLEHVTVDSFSANPRYQLLNEQIIAARGEDLHLHVEGVAEGGRPGEVLDTYVDSIAPEAACTSVQFHLRVTPDRFAPTWNAAQALAGPQVAVGANSPFLFGHRLWDETRIALFQQATDTRSEEIAAQGVRPRVWFGERWIDSPLELFEENARFFPALLPLCEDEDPEAVRAAGGVPELPELRLHNGTVYRWNRPVYDVAGGVPHLRVENRVLPAGPTVTDVVANAAFYYGAVHALARAEVPVSSALAFATAEDNFTEGARRGLGATMTWPGVGPVPVQQLVLEVLLPLAHEGLAALGTDRAVADRLLGIIADRTASGRNGAAWQVATVRAHEESGADRDGALAAMTRRYVELMRTGEPVHTWPVGAGDVPAG